MQSKHLLIALAAFALTTTSAQAYWGQNLIKSGLTSEQVVALKDARELRRRGEVDKARDRLVEAGIDEASLQAMRTAAMAAKSRLHKAIEQADYQGFLEAIEGTPLRDVIQNEDDFLAFVQAHALHQEKNHEAAQEIYDELGVTRAMLPFGHRHGRIRGELDEATKEALQVARQANDREAVRAILDEAGFGMHKW